MYIHEKSDFQILAIFFSFVHLKLNANYADARKFAQLPNDIVKHYYSKIIHRFIRNFRLPQAYMYIFMY